MEIPTRRAALHQLAWHAREQARGALALIAGVDFPATIEGFLAWYQKSSLERRSMRIGAAKPTSPRQHNRAGGTAAI